METYKKLVDEVGGLDDEELEARLEHAEKEASRARGDGDKAAERYFLSLAKLLKDEATARADEDEGDAEEEEDNEAD